MFLSPEHLEKKIIFKKISLYKCYIPIIRLNLNLRYFTIYNNIFKVPMIKSFN